MVYEAADGELYNLFHFFVLCGISIHVFYISLQITSLYFFLIYFLWYRTLFWIDTWNIWIWIFSFYCEFLLCVISFKSFLLVHWGRTVCSQQSSSKKKNPIPSRIRGVDLVIAKHHFIIRCWGISYGERIFWVLTTIVLRFWLLIKKYLIWRKMHGNKTFHERNLFFLPQLFQMFDFNLSKIKPVVISCSNFLWLN